MQLMESVVRQQENPSRDDYAYCALYAWNSGRYQECRVYIEQSLQKHGRTSETLQCLMQCCAKLDDYNTAFAYGHELLKLGVKTHDVYSAMAHACWCGAKDAEGAAHYGALAITARDAGIPALPPQIFPQRKAFDPDKKTRNIISFSLWGETGRYLRGAVRNALLVHDLYPFWTCRFYLDESVPEDVTALLRELQAQIVVMPRPKLPFEGLGWRFQVWDDKDVDFCLVRDCDAVVSVFETTAVNAWLRSGRWFHIMRDWYTHTDVILAGLWGGATGVLNNLYTGYVRSLSGGIRTRTADQAYLGQYAWPVIKQNVLIHDRLHRLPGIVPFPDADFCPDGGGHIGMNEAAATPAKQAMLLREYGKRCPSLFKKSVRTEKIGLPKLKFKSNGKGKYQISF
ncbi:MAG: hypothetical protein LBC79_10355 [Deltaproteobacteria bacterium]|nr:hypothetical protein [Deltaproteobacteria bacterium]